MRHNGFHGIVRVWRELARVLSPGALALAFAMFATGALAYGLEHAARRGAREVGQEAGFRIQARPAIQRVTAGATARYRIVIVRRRYRRALDLIVQVPSQLHLELSSGGKKAKPDRGQISRGRRRRRRRGGGRWIRLRIAHNRAVLSVTVDRSVKPGAYAIRLRGVGGAFSAVLSLKLSVAAPSPASVNIGGDVSDLMPGVPRAIDLVLKNPGAKPIAVTGLSVAMSTISAPLATAALPCGTDDFSVAQFGGSYPLSIPAHASVDLAGLGIPVEEWPQVTLLDRAVDQDGCQGATLSLTYMGTAAST